MNESLKFTAEVARGVLKAGDYDERDTRNVAIAIAAADKQRELIVAWLRDELQRQLSEQAGRLGNAEPAKDFSVVVEILQMKISLLNAVIEGLD